MTQCESSAATSANHHLTDALQSLERLALDVDPDEGPLTGLDTEASWLASELREIRERLRNVLLRVETPRTLPPVPAVPPLHLSNDAGNNVQLRRILRQRRALTKADCEFALNLARSACPTGARLLFVGRVRCPWLAEAAARATVEVADARLVCVYSQAIRQTLSPASSHERAAVGVQDVTLGSGGEGLLSMVEAAHFCQHLGRPHWAELLCLPVELSDCPQWLLYADAAWKALMESPSTASRLVGTPLRRLCLAQGIGSVTKKIRGSSPGPGSLRLRSDVTVAELCATVRLLNHARLSLLGQPPRLREPPEIDGIPEGVLAGWRALFVQPLADIIGGGFGDALLAWHAQLVADCDAVETAEVTGTGPELKPKDLVASRRNLLQSKSAEEEAALAQWRWTELLDPALRPMLTMSSNVEFSVESALTSAGLPSDLLPRGLATPAWRIELAACAGSRMYGLNTPESDVDYLLVYSRADEFQRLRHPPDTAESRGPDKSVEFGCCEAAEFARQLLRGSIVQLELLFAAPSARLFVSPGFDWLLQRRGQFVTENFIRQLLGLASQLVRVLRKAEANSEQMAPAEARKAGKAAYQLEHKLNLLADLAAGREPRVTLEADERDRVLSLRAADWADAANRARLARLTLDRHRKIKQALASRTSRLPENCPIDLLTDWLYVVHGCDPSREV